VVGDRNGVLDPDPVSPLEVHAGLDGNHCAGSELGVVAFDDRRRLVYADADAVPGPGAGELP
jgi:hypothetical protein